MQTDTLNYDTLNNRPLPKWLIDQKEGLTTIQPQKIEMREDNSLRISFIATSVFILFTVIIVTVYILRKEKVEAKRRPRAKRGGEMKKSKRSEDPEQSVGEK